MPDQIEDFVKGEPKDMPEIKALSLDNVKDILSRSGADISQIDLSKVKTGNIDLSQLGLDPSTMGLPDLARLNLGGLDMRQVIGTVPKDMPGIHDNKELKELVKLPDTNSSEVVGTLIPGTSTLKPIESSDAIPFVQNKTPLTHAPVNVAGKWNGQGRWSITDEFGNVRIGSVDLPGIFSSMSISQDVEMESKEVKGRSGKAKQITGYSDAKISLSLILDSDDKETAYDKLVRIQSAFRSTDRAAIPKVMKIINKHVQARGIEQVIFKSLNSSEGNGDSISVSLEFEEYYPVIPVGKEGKSSNPPDKTGTTGAYTGGLSDDERLEGTMRLREEEIKELEHRQNQREIELNSKYDAEIQRLNSGKMTKDEEQEYYAGYFNPQEKAKDLEKEKLAKIKASQEETEKQINNVKQNGSRAEQAVREAQNKDAFMETTLGTSSNKLKQDVNKRNTNSIVNYLPGPNSYVEESKLESAIGAAVKSEAKAKEEAQQTVANMNRFGQPSVLDKKG